MNLKLLKVIRFFHLINKKNYNEKRQIEIVKNSPLFDAKWYLAQNPDVKAKKIGAAKHYVKYGWKEGRNPSPDFDSEEYLAEYPELKVKNWCPLFHYMLEHKELMPKIDYKVFWNTYCQKYVINTMYYAKQQRFKIEEIFGKYKGKDINYKIIAQSKYFNKHWYLKTNPDIKQSGIDPIEHYIKYGWKEGRNPSKYFDGNRYLDKHQDVKKAKMNPLIHYLRYGVKEKRIIFSTQDNIKFEENKPNIWDKLICQYKNKNPKISVIVASYNYQDYIKETLDSLLAQTYTNYEIIVVDDGSTDDSLKVIKKYTKKYPKIQCHRHQGGKNRGLPETIKLALTKATGEYIAFCESDDRWLPNYLEEKVKLINNYANPKIIINDVKIFGNKERCVVVQNMLDERKRKYIQTKLKFSVTEFREKNWIVTFSCCMVKTDELKKCNITDVPRKANLDWWLWRQLCCNNTVFYINKQLTEWRIHNSYMVKESITSVLRQEEFLQKGDEILLKKHILKALPLLNKYKIKHNKYYVENYKIYRKHKLTQQPKFSIIMPTYNREFCINNAISSVLNQTYQNFELIIVDDGSTDGTENLILRKYNQEIKQGKIRYVKKNNEGVCKARNVGLARAQNEWITYVDSDNEIVPEFLETFAINILEHPKIKLLYAKLICIVSKKVIGKRFQMKDIKSGNFIDLGTFVHHKSIYNQLGGFDENMTRLVDWELIVRYTEKSFPYFIDKIVLVYNDSKDYNRITTNINLANNLNYFKKKHCPEYITVTTMITSYNHEQYISEAIESAIKQTGDFIHEILISDDGSTDRTPEIINEYAKQYPYLIKNISHKTNVGISANMKHCFEQASGKYIAVLEGDDYWTDEKKLEKQMQFLEKNKDCSMVFSRIKLLTPKKVLMLLDRHNGLKNKITGDDFCKELSLIVNFSCCMFISEYMKNLPNILYKYRLSEISLAFYLEQKGKIGFMKNPMSVYRQHANGVWSGSSKRQQINQGISCIQITKEICDTKYKKFMQEYIDKKNFELKKLRDYDYYKNLPTSMYISALKEWYKNITKDDLNLDNPRTFNEKIQWLKLYDSTPIKTRLADKYLVREWIKEKIGEQYLIPLLGVYDKFEDINFDKLSNQFVIKCNHGSAYNIIVKDKNKLDLADVKAKLNKWMNENFAFKAGYELHYRNIKPKIIIEKFIENKGADDLYDYKFWCFDGKVAYIQFLSERNLSGLKIAFYDRNWIKQDFYDNNKFDEKVMPKPKSLDKMIKLAEILSKSFNFVRVDFYQLENGEIYFGEMTFTPSSGSMKWSNEQINLELGNMIKLPKMVYNIDTGEYDKL